MDRSRAEGMRDAIYRESAREGADPILVAWAMRFREAEAAGEPIEPVAKELVELVERVLSWAEAFVKVLTETTGDTLETLEAKVKGADIGIRAELLMTALSDPVMNEKTNEVYRSLSSVNLRGRARE